MAQKGVSIGALIETSHIWCALAIATVLAFASTPCAAAETVTWKAELPANLPPRESEVVQKFARTLEEAALPVRIRTPEQKSTSHPAQALQDTQAGVVQLTLVPVNILTATLPEFAVFDSIFLFKDLAAVDRYTSSVEGRRLLDSLQKQGLHGLGFVHAGMVQIVTRKPLEASTGFKGLKVAPALGGDSIARQFGALGATTQRLPGGEVYAALNNGVIDATEAGWTELSRLPIAGPGVSVLESNHRYRGYVLVANNAAFQQLGEIEQTRLLAAAEKVIDGHNSATKKGEDEARKKVVKDMSAVTVVTGTNYDALFAQLKERGWTTAKDQQPALASALSISDPALASTMAAWRPKNRLRQRPPIRSNWRLQRAPPTQRHHCPLRARVRPWPTTWT